MEKIACELVIKDNRNVFAQEDWNKMAQEVLMMAFPNIWALHSANEKSF